MVSAQGRKVLGSLDGVRNQHDARGVTGAAEWPRFGDTGSSMTNKTLSSPIFNTENQVVPPPQAASAVAQKMQFTFGVALSSIPARSSARMKIRQGHPALKRSRQNPPQPSFKAKETQASGNFTYVIPGSARPATKPVLGVFGAKQSIESGLQNHFDDSCSPSPRRKTAGIDDSSLTARQEAIVEETIAQPRVPFPVTPLQRLQVVQSLRSNNHDEIVHTLGNLNLLSADIRNLFLLTDFPDILSAFHAIINRHLEDLSKSRSEGMPPWVDLENLSAPLVLPMPAVNLVNAGSNFRSIGVSHPVSGSCNGSSLQQYGDVFNVRDSIFVNREQGAALTLSVLRNASFDERNAQFLATSRETLALSAEVLLNFKEPSPIRHDISVAWTNISPFVSASEEHCGKIMLKTCVKLLDSSLENANANRYVKSCEILMHLAANSSQNEEKFCAEFDVLLPRLVDLIHEEENRLVSAGLSVLYHCSSFDSHIRSRIASQPRCMSRLVNLLQKPEQAQCAAFIISRLAEIPSNRNTILAFENELIMYAFSDTLVAGTISSVLFDLNHD